MRLEAVKVLWDRLRRHGVRGLEPDGFTDSELAFGRLVLPVLEDFEETRVLLSEAEKRARALLVLLDRLPVSALVLDADGRLLALNRSARTVLGGVTTHVLDAAQRAARTGEELEVRVPETEKPLRFVPAEPSDGGSASADPTRPQVVFVVERDAPPAVNLTSLVQRCHLSRAEASVVGLVAQGYSNEVIAQRLAISVETVRSHLASTYRKTGAPNRTSLVALAFCAPFGQGPYGNTARHSA